MQGAEGAGCEAQLCHHGGQVRCVWCAGVVIIQSGGGSKLCQYD